MLEKLEEGLLHGGSEPDKVQKPLSTQRLHRSSHACGPTDCGGVRQRRMVCPAIIGKQHAKRLSPGFTPGFLLRQVQKHPRGGREEQAREPEGADSLPPLSKGEQRVAQNRACQGPKGGHSACRGLQNIREDAALIMHTPSKMRIGRNAVASNGALRGVNARWLSP